MTGALAWVAGSGVVQGVIIGATLAFLTATLLLDAVARALAVRSGGWRSLRQCGRPGNGILVRAACAKALPVVNVFEEAAYWTGACDQAGRRLRGGRDYVVRFPYGQFPPNDAFWSLTLTDPVGYGLGRGIGPSAVDDRSPLRPNADGSVDLFLQREAPAGHEANWLPTPSGRFLLTLRAYLPGRAVLDGSYRPPPIVRRGRS